LEPVSWIRGCLALVSRRPRLEGWLRPAHFPAIALPPSRPWPPPGEFRLRGKRIQIPILKSAQENSRTESYPKSGHIRNDYSGTRVDVFRNRGTQVDATNKERRPCTKLARTQLLWFRSKCNGVKTLLCAFRRPSMSLGNPILALINRFPAQRALKNCSQARF
jgi:hypothetical protein